MEKKTWSVTLADGTSAKGLGKNGNNYISKKELTPDFFTGRLSTVTVEGPDGVQTIQDAKLVQLTKEADGWWFILGEKTPEEKIKERLEKAIKDSKDDVNAVELALAEIVALFAGGSTPPSA